jgi:hypothetical protein
MKMQTLGENRVMTAVRTNRTSIELAKFVVNGRKLLFAIGRTKIGYADNSNFESQFISVSRVDSQNFRTAIQAALSREPLPDNIYLGDHQAAQGFRRIITRFCRLCRF